MGFFATALCKQQNTGHLETKMNATTALLLIVLAVHPIRPWIGPRGRLVLSAMNDSVVLEEGGPVRLSPCLILGDPALEIIEISAEVFVFVVLVGRMHVKDLPWSLSAVHLGVDEDGVILEQHIGTTVLPWCRRLCHSFCFHGWIVGNGG